MKALRTRQISLSDLERKLKAAERTGRPRGKGLGTASQREEEPSSSGLKTSGEAPKRSGSTAIDSGPATISSAASQRLSEYASGSANSGLPHCYQR